MAVMSGSLFVQTRSSNARSTGAATHGARGGEAEVLLLKERKAEEYQEGLAHFIEQFDHLNQMINDLILLSKMSAWSHLLLRL